MVLVKILKRRDASSLIVAIVIASIIGQTLFMIAQQLAGKLSGDSYGFGGEGGPGWKTMYLTPVLSAVLQLVALELLAWLVIGVNKLLATAKQRN